jgi:hypothetical protein
MDASGKKSYLYMLRLWRYQRKLSLLVFDVIIPIHDVQLRPQLRSRPSFSFPHIQE